ncbi:fimbria/pilus chaperone family protein [Burkholderia cepacia]|uniref:fimbria/pilus chaperone family protein n=1 Tax=Burkholderia cepacia TaxID=292 RepID=UPI0009BEF35A|nr:fimbria/pilus chaperone family protein [Burkholderia cepacia]
MFSIPTRSYKTSLTLLLFLAARTAYAAGVVPDTSVVIVNEENGEGTMIVRNTDNRPTLLYTNIHVLDGTPKDLVIASPTMARIEAGGSQLVRFMLNTDKPLDKEYLDRVTFEGIPPKNPGKSQVQTLFRQDLPLIVHPRNLPKMDRPWANLTASISNGEVRLCNPSRYVVRLDQHVDVFPGNGSTNIKHAFLLPGEIATGQVKKLSGAASSVRIFPATVYGYLDKSFDIPLTNRCVAPTAPQ